MDNNPIQMPGYRQNEYLLILDLPEPLRNKVMEVKTEFYEKYKAPSARYAKPHITLIKFVQFEMMESQIVNSLNIIAMGYFPFKIELRDYGSFPSHTIFINVETKQQVQNLVKELRAAQRLMKLNKDIKAHFIDDPHLTVARKLLPWQYEKGWLEYSNKKFTGRFIAESMLLIKRMIGTMPYQIVQRFDFMNLPVSTRQGELFI